MLQWREDGRATVPIHDVSLAEGWGERTLLRVLLDESLSIGICLAFRQRFHGAAPFHASSFALGVGCTQGPRPSLSKSLPGGVPRAE